MSFNCLLTSSTTASSSCCLAAIPPPPSPPPSSPRTATSTTSTSWLPPGLPLPPAFLFIVYRGRRRSNMLPSPTSQRRDHKARQCGVRLSVCVCVCMCVCRRHADFPPFFPAVFLGGPRGFFYFRFIFLFSPSLISLEDSPSHPPPQLPRCLIQRMRRCSTESPQ